jgi:hypothetical protein
MARTVSEAIARARQSIADPDGARAGTATCEGYVRDALNIVKQQRPDLFLGQFATDISALVSANDLPISDQYFLPVAMFVAGMIETQDDESSDRARGELVARLGGSML